MSDAIPRHVPFSLVCEECDAGLEIRNYEQAVTAGWTNIVFAPDLPMANFVGLCPDCRREEEQAASSVA